MESQRIGPLILSLFTLSYFLFIILSLDYLGLLSHIAQAPFSILIIVT